MGWAVQGDGEILSRESCLLVFTTSSCSCSRPRLFFEAQSLGRFLGKAIFDARELKVFDKERSAVGLK